MMVTDVFGNHWKAVPYSAAALVSGDAFLILFHLMRKSKGFMSEEPVEVSLYTLSSLTGKSRNSVKNYINELIDFGLITTKKTPARSSSLFVINWEELKSIHQITSRLSDEGLGELRIFCRSKDAVPFSSYNIERWKYLLEGFGYEYKPRSISDLGQESARSISDLGKTHARSNFDLGQESARSNFDLGQESARSISDLGKTHARSNFDLGGSNFDLGKTHARSEIDLGKESARSISDLARSNFDLGNMNTDKARSKIDLAIQSLGQNLTYLYENMSKNEDEVKEFNKILESVRLSLGQILTYPRSNSDLEGGFARSNFDLQYKRYIKDKKDQYGEAVIGMEENEKTLQAEISSAKASEKRVFLDSRDLELPRLSNFEFKSIIDNPRFNNTDYDMIVREVWNEIGSEARVDGEDDGEEVYEDENMQADTIPVSLFNKILFEVWSDLKEQSPDFSLTEEQVKNIFGFDVVEVENEFCYLIDSSNIRNINNTSDDSEEKPTRADNLQFSRMDNRIARELFVESLKEIADKDVNELTDMEYAVLRLDDFVVDREKTGMKRFDEITAIQMNDLIQDTAREAKVSEIALKQLSRPFKKTPNSPTARIRITAIDFEKVFEYNRENNQDSVVEVLMKEKLAAYKNTTASDDSDLLFD